MPGRGDLQTLYADAACPTPSGSMAGGGTSGGMSLGDGTPTETANSMSGMPAAQSTVEVAGGSNAPGSQIAMPPVASPGTFKTEGV